MRRNPEDDLVRCAIEEARRRFGGEDDGMFNSAGFSLAFMRLCGLRGVLDGKVCAGILQSRPEVERLGKAHWRWAPSFWRQVGLYLSTERCLGCAGRVRRIREVLSSRREAAYCPWCLLEMQSEKFATGAV